MTECRDVSLRGRRARTAGSGSPGTQGGCPALPDHRPALEKLWIYYYGIGGDLDEVSLDAYLHDALDIPAAQVHLIDTAMMEMMDEEEPP